MLVNRLLVAFLLPFLGYAEYFCPKETGDACVLPGGAVFIIDTSSDLSNDVITQQFEYVRRNIFPYLPSYNVSIALMSYGTGDTSTDPYTSNVTEACIMLDTLQNSFISQGTYAVTLLKALKIYEVVYYEEDTHTLFDGSPYPVFLFTATKNVDDIKASAQYINKHLPDAQLNVIAFNNSALLESLNFPASYVYSFFDLTYQNTDFHVCMRALMCGYLKKCNALGSTVTFTTPVVTKPLQVSTTSVPVTFATTPVTTRSNPTTKATPVSTPRSGGGGDGTKSSGYCECEVGKVWNDVIYLVESSDGTMKNGFEDIIAYIQTVTAFFNVQKNGYTGTDYFMRMGLIVYSKTAQVVAGLGTLNNADVQDLNLPFLDTSDEPDIEGAIQLAIAQFEKQRDRLSSRKVIVLIASTYDPLSSRAPQVVMNDFHADGGISIVLDYYESVGTDAKHLSDLASAGYYFYSKNSTLPDMLQAQCDANCFCKINYVYLPEGIRVLPTQGCDYPVDIESSYALAERNCDRNYGNSHLTVSKTPEKNMFIANLTGALGNIYSTQLLGLSLKSGIWTWDDGTTVGPYQNWGSPPTNNPDNGGCAITNFNTGKWSQANCRSAYPYVCEKKPCSSVNYCADLKT